MCPPVFLSDSIHYAQHQPLVALGLLAFSSGYYTWHSPTVFFPLNGFGDEAQYPSHRSCGGGDDLLHCPIADARGAGF